jgi:predicted alpha/beta hydrolase family esterase
MNPAPPAATRILLLPGWQNSGPGHWQSLWEAEHGDQRVEQADWFWPRRGDWMAQLEEAVLASPQPAVLAAHSLGCHLVAAWAAHSRHTERVQGALLVAPPDLARADMPPQLAPWQPPVLQRLPFPARLLYSSDDPYGGVEASLALAQAWGATATPAGAAGHLNAESKLGHWPQARQWLHDLAAAAGQRS